MAQSFTTTEVAATPLINGTLFEPEKKSDLLAIVIAGSGPTNRSGNQIGLHNNSLKYLAECIAGNGFAVYAYDKRLFALLNKPDFKENDLTFDHFAEDAREVVQYFRTRFRKIVIIGHSEGSLIGMLAAEKADGFISIAGPGRPAAEVLEEQLAKQFPGKMPAVREVLAHLTSGKTVAPGEDYIMQSVFRESVQPYMISWFKYNPQQIIRNLKIPVLIINGTKDLQVPENEALLLHKARPSSEMTIIKNMNHILKNIEGGDEQNQASYNQPQIPLAPELCIAVNQFLNNLGRRTN